FLRPSMSPGPGLTGSKAREDWRIEMITACGATPTTPSGAPDGGGCTSGSSGCSVPGSPGPFDGASGTSGGGGGAADTVCVIVTGDGGGGGAGGGGAPPGGGAPASVAGGPVGGGNAGVLGIRAGTGMPCGAAPITEATMVPWASQSVRPSPAVI